MAIIILSSPLVPITIIIITIVIIIIIFIITFDVDRPVYCSRFSVCNVFFSWILFNIVFLIDPFFKNFFIWWVMKLIIDWCSHPKMLYQITYIPSQINLTTNVSVLKQALNKTVREKSIQRNSKPANHHLSLWFFPFIFHLCLQDN